MFVNSAVAPTGTSVTVPLKLTETSPAAKFVNVMVFIVSSEQLRKPTDITIRKK
jgi:hypothetical protein